MPLQAPRCPIGVPVEALEGQHPVVLAHAEPVGDSIGIESGGVDDVADADALGLRAHPARSRSGDRGAKADFAAALAHAIPERLDNRDGIGDRRRWRPEGTFVGAREGLDLHQLQLVDHLQRYAVCLAARVEVIELRQLLRRCRDDDLAGLAHGHAALGAEGAQHLIAAPRELGLKGVGRVVEAGMQHPGIAARCMRGEPILLVKDDDARPWVRGEPRVRECEADDASADDGDVGCAHVLRLGPVS